MEDHIMKHLLLVISAAFLIFSCSKNGEEEAFTRYHEDGRAKPVVAVVSVIDSTSYDLSWSLSDELTTLIRSKLSQRRSLYVSPKEDVDQYISYSNDPFDPDISWMNKDFGSYEFIVFIELLDHKNISEQDPEKVFYSPNYQNDSTNLIEKARIRVVDVRGKKPHIILQETLNDSYFISKNQLRTNYNIDTWITNSYRSTPLSLAHNQMTKKITERIEDYIMLAKSR